LNGPKAISVKEIARCSREFFICSQKSQDFAEFVPLLGSKAGITSEEEIKKIVGELISTDFK
jgi:hypothetical protein